MYDKYIYICIHDNTYIYTQGGVKMDPATQLFQYGHELGNIDSSYTYAQLLRTGILYVHNYMN